MRCRWIAAQIERIDDEKKDSGSLRAVLPEV